MKIYIYAESDDLEEIAEPLTDAISDWLKKSGSNAELVNDRQHSDSDNTDSFWNLGLNISVKRKSDLRKALDPLYSIAKTERCDFVVGRASSKSGPAQDICYFGYEEGKPDVHEIANYLGFR